MSTPKRPSLTEQRIYSWFFRLSALHGELLAYRLDLHERKRIGGLLLPLGPGLVMTTAHRISGQPHLFPDTPAPGPVLRDRQRRALALLHLRDRLRDMASLVDDAYLVVQTELTSPTLAFVSKALAQDHPAEIALADLPSRNLALVPAFLLVHAYYQAKRMTRDRNKASKKAAVATTAEGGPGPPKRSARKAHAEADRRAHARTQAENLFLDLLRSRRRRDK